MANNLILYDNGETFEVFQNEKDKIFFYLTDGSFSTEIPIEKQTAYELVEFIIDAFGMGYRIP